MEVSRRVKYTEKNPDIYKEFVE